MSSESHLTPSEMQAVLERLISSRNRDLSMFIPLLFGLARPEPENSNPDSDHNSENQTDPDDQMYRDRIVLINPLSQGMVVIEGEDLDSLFRGAQTKDGPPPASKSSVEAMPRVEIVSGEETECVICLEECGVESVVKEMPCKHRFHGPCIEKWLGLHGSCPVCRYSMPVEEKKRDEEGGERRRREIWVSFSFGGRRRRGDDVEERENGNSRNSDDVEERENGNSRNSDDVEERERGSNVESSRDSDGDNVQESGDIEMGN